MNIQSYAAAKQVIAIYCERIKASRTVAQRAGALTQRYMLAGWSAARACCVVKRQLLGGMA